MTFKELKIIRQVEGGNEFHEFAASLLLTCQKGLNEPRLPSLKGIMAAKKKEVLTLSANELDLGMINTNNNRVIEKNLCLPPEQKKGIILQGTDESVSVSWLACCVIKKSFN